MKLRNVSITGADDAVDIGALNTLGEEFPFVEWAVLLLPEQMGKPRCPTISWIDDFKKNYTGAHKAMHLCGSALLGFVQGNKDILGLMEGFERVQLNLGFGDVEGKYETDALIAQIVDTPEHEFIIQYTDDRAGLLPRLQGIPNHALLFDGSAGAGLSPARWPAPVDGHECGYAGGLKPDNLRAQIEMIAKAAGEYTTWIDMETGVRTDDRLDLEKVRSVLETAQPYITC